MIKLNRILMLSLILLPAAAFGQERQRGVVQGYASADSEQNACRTAVFSAQQNMPRGARMIDYDCTCGGRTSMGRQQCTATVTWERRSTD